MAVTAAHLNAEMILVVRVTDLTETDDRKGVVRDCVCVCVCVCVCCTGVVIKYNCILFKMSGMNVFLC